ncbi:MAG: glycosyltransferase [Acidobacteriota bacterium]
MRETPIAIRTIHLDQPIPELLEVSGYARTKLLVMQGDIPLGTVEISNNHQPVSATRLRDAIVEKFGSALLKPLLAGHYRFADSTEHSTMPLPDEVSVSVVVATFDRPEALRKCLTCLTAQTTSRPVEIIVVDNHPSSGLTAPVVAEFAGARLVSEPRKGLSYARNQGINQSNGEIIVCTDDDVAMPPGWLEKLLAPFADPKVGIVTGNIFPAELETASQILFEAYGGLSRGFERRVVNKNWFKQFRTAVPTWELGATANAAFRSTLFCNPEVGLLHEALGAGTPTGCSEDTYLFYRALKADYTLVYEPVAYVWHNHRRDRKGLRRQIYNYSKGHVAYHLITLLKDRDKRALVRLLIRLPQTYLSRAKDRILGHSSYPLSLVLLEIAGNLAGLWALWSSLRRVKRLGRSPVYIEPALRQPSTIACETQADESRREASPHAKTQWKNNQLREVDFWRQYVNTGGLQWQSDFKFRTDPQAVLQEAVIIDYLRETDHESIAILDVGAGPLTTLGKIYPGKILHITAVDPLAQVYRQILKDAGIAPPVETVAGEAETILAQFDAKSFDIAFARNALDSSYDPILAIQNMFAVVKENGCVLLKHKINQAEQFDYRGSQQWNFSIKQGRFVIWDRTAEYDIAELLGDRADLDAYEEGEWVTCAITKLSESAVELKKTQRRFATEPGEKTLVAGWFSFQGAGATAGDLMARDLVCDWLDEAGCLYEVAHAAPFTGGVDWRLVDPRDYTQLVFVCGPFGDSPTIKKLLRRFAGCRLIGVDLSMLESLDLWNPFDRLFERDSSKVSRPDITFLSSKNPVPVVGVVLVDSQAEYKDAGKHQLVNDAIHQLIASREMSAVPIDTRLDANRTGLRTPVEVESLIARMDVVLTTRLHGLVLALKNGVPALVVDPVAGGAKIKRQAETIGWQVVFTPETITAEALQQAFDYCLTEAARVNAVKCCERARRMVEQVRQAFVAELAQKVQISQQQA